VFALGYWNLADEYDAAQERGEVQQPPPRSKRRRGLPRATQIGCRTPKHL
jgi:hypothetical protein